MNEGQTHPLSIDQCCQTIRTMAICEKADSKDVRCFVKRNSSKFVQANAKAYELCKGEIP